MKKFIQMGIITFSLFNIFPVEAAMAIPRCAHCQGKPMVYVISKATPQKDEMIKKVLELQETLLVDPLASISQDSLKDGFLLTAMDADYINYLLNEKNGVIICVTQKQVLLGYAILVNTSQFKKLFENESVGQLDSALQMDDFARNDSAYIEQIAVRKSAARQGIGSKLIDTCKKLKHALLADVFINPVSNDASLQFFTDQGFENVGILYQQPTEKLPFSQELKVFLWKLL
ncbi:GNAT family N-acetyltransferase [Criblamydia sequanensis]|uniref:Acetyltransferase, GNAT family n=1 Tax=Candidatus Criblamydia sequanensis CRIB-18 TaxID=1437425 RepID=A0A090D1B9_9BACT|nr:GNAT family N-acetyltransferase [Criblamydia sequanensis]CDR35176.1 Acetyltransferase, GNAT family [Criblamydia sequanensis CRIB-18]